MIRFDAEFDAEFDAGLDAGLDPECVPERYPEFDLVADPELDPGLAFGSDAEALGSQRLGRKTGGGANDPSFVPSSVRAGDAVRL